MQVTYGIATASSNGFYGCLANYLEPAMAAKWNAHIRTVSFFGHVVASISAGMIVSHFRLQITFTLTLICLLVALLFSILILIWKVLRGAKFLQPIDKNTRDDIFIPSVNVLLLSSVWILVYSTFGICENYFSSIVYLYANEGGVDLSHSGYFDALGKIASFCSSMYLSMTSWWQKDLRTGLFVCIPAILALGTSMIILSLLDDACTNVKISCLWAILMSTGSAVGTMLISKMIELLNASGRMVTFFIAVNSMIGMFIMSLVQLTLDGHGACERFYILGWITSTLPLVPLVACIFTAKS